MENMQNILLNYDKINTSKRENRKNFLKKIMI